MLSRAPECQLFFTAISVSRFRGRSIHGGRRLARNQVVQTFWETQMIRFAALLVLGCAFALPSVAAAKDCGGCDPCAPCASACDCQPAACCNPCVRTRLKLVRVCKEVTRCKRVCVLDECGCPTMRRVPCTRTVSRLRLVRVPVQPRCRACCPPAVTPCCGN